MNHISIETLYQRNIKGQETKKYQLFVVPIGNTNITERMVFHPEAPVLKYHQESSNSFCLISLTSTFHSISEDRAINSLANCTEESLTLKTNISRNIVDSANDILKKQLHHNGEQHLRYNLKKWKK